MADHGSSGSQANSHSFEAHKAAYEGFLKGSIVLSLLCFYILVALVAFRFVGNWNVLLGFTGLILGSLALLIDARAVNRAPAQRKTAQNIAFAYAG